MLTYALRSALTLALPYSGFLVLPCHETLHRLNSLLQLFSLAASIVLPLVHVTVEHPLPLLMNREAETVMEVAARPHGGATTLTNIFNRLSLASSRTKAKPLKLIGTVCHK